MARRSRTRASALLMQDSPQDDLSVRVEFSCRNESEPGVEAGRAPLAGHMAGEQLGGALAAHQFHDLSHDLPAVALALMPVVDEQLPEEPRAVDLGRLRLDVPAQHDEPDR